MPVINEEAERARRHEVIYEHQEPGFRGEQREAREETITAATVTGGSTLELVAGAAAVVLSLIGLSKFMPFYMSTISTIVIGGALLVHGASTSARWNDLVRRAAETRNERIELAGGLGSEMFGGVCGIVLGILALAGILPSVLLSIAAIVFGGSLLLAAPAEPEIARVAPDRSSRMGRVTYEAVETSTGAMVLAGAGAVVLGIIALLRVAPPFTLVMVSMLVIGAALFLSGSALTARFGRRLQHLS